MKHPIDLRLAPEDVHCPHCEQNAWNKFVEAFYMAVADTKAIPSGVDLMCESCGEDFAIELSMEIEL